MSATGDEKKENGEMVEAKVATAERSVATAEAKVKTAKEEIARAEAKVATAEAKVATAEAKVANARKEAAKAEENVMIAEGRVARAKAEAASEDLDSARKDLESATRKENFANKMVDSAFEELNAGHRQVACAQQELDSAQQELNSAQQELKSAQTLLTAARNELAAQADGGKQLKRKHYELLQVAQEAFSESGTKKSEKLLRVKHLPDGTKRCFLCATNVNVQASHIFQKSDTSLRRNKTLGIEALEILMDWSKGYKWRRPFEIHGPMNLIWLCRDHHSAFDKHNFCLKIDMNNRVLFHPFHHDFFTLTEQANTRLMNDAEPYYDMDYVSKRAVGMCIYQSQERRQVYLDPNNKESWKAVVAFSAAVSARAESESGAEQEGPFGEDSAGSSSQQLSQFDVDNTIGDD